MFWFHLLSKLSLLIIGNHKVKRQGFEKGRSVLPRRLGSSGKMLQ
jgi:hypothetical protein